MRTFLTLAVAVGLLTAAPASGQTAGAPAGLVASSATRRAVALTWTAPDSSTSSFVVERKPLGASWTPPAPPAVSPIVSTPVTQAAFTDSTIGPFATYVYRVRQLPASKTPGPPSNEITVGPPPVGFSQILTPPASLKDPNQFADCLSMTLDANGDPAVVYFTFDPDNNADNADSTLHFVSWSRAKYRWNPPVKVATVADIASNGLRYGFSLTRDASTGQFGIVHMTGSREVRLALSADEGVTWSDVSVQMVDEQSTLGEPTLAMDKGRLWIVYTGTDRDVVLVTGAATETPDKWTRSQAPLLPETFSPKRAGLQVTLDAAGKPAVLYWLDPNSGYNASLALWRPDAKTVVKIADTKDSQSDVVDSRIVFNGSRASVAFHARRDDQYFDNKHQIWVATSADNGATWSGVVPLPNDGGNSVGPPVSIAVDGQGNRVVVAPVDGGNDGDRKCGSPKLFRESAAGWTVCAPDSRGTAVTGSTQPRIAFADNNKLYIALRIYQDGGGLKSGLLLWRER
ncbi:MAG TPA: fibronectin type III domain-containing protein [Vicinamibacterales bacterium]|nr:fibronectin type III domain-containing protein [Vicinamibacterales bacterium]